MGQAISDMQKIAERSIFLQDGGASPNSQPFYRGEAVLGGINTPQGDVTAIYLPSRSQPNNWDIVDVYQGAEGLPTSDFTARTNVKIYRKWQNLRMKRCPFTVYAKHDACGRPDDPRSWDYKNILYNTRFTDFSDAAVGTLQGDDQAPVELTGSFSAQKEYIVYPIKFEEVADAAILSDVLDGFYSSVASCGGKCGERKDECNNFYALTALNSGSPGLSSQLIVTTDNKESWNALDIPTLGGLAGSAIADAGSYIVLVSAAMKGHQYISFNKANELDPSGWVLIQTDYPNAIGGFDVFALSPEEIYIAASDGYAFRLESPTGSPTTLTDGSIVSDDLKHVDGYISTVVFAGDNGKVLVTQNQGDSLVLKPITLIDGTVITGNVTALSVLSDNIWFLAVGGVLYYTVNTGETYSIKGLDATISVINDIRFSNPLIGYFVAEVAGVGTVYRTHDAGYSWFNDDPDIDGIPTAVRFNFAAPCGTNEVAVGGRVTVSGDGVLSIAS